MELGALEMWYAGSKGVRLRELVPLREVEEDGVAHEEDKVDDVESGLGSVPGGLDTAEWEDLNVMQYRRKRRRAFSLLEEDLVGVPNGTPIDITETQLRATIWTNVKDTFCWLKWVLLMVEMPTFFVHFVRLRTCFGHYSSAGFTEKKPLSYWILIIGSINDESEVNNHFMEFPMLEYYVLDTMHKHLLPISQAKWSLLKVTYGSCNYTDD
ncbi:hypothetical protein CAPTEDRAFT_190172 [Capitella teleta]|uniref:Uncharacterized protein n=1 Tax=Capitella teleta TaxID=283909 RepID=R7UMC0_CAPTE|nr:hypothetical protein CAPTEDRAFT_190172 [Capitella teleta]|eukprot:ELU07248.1 hypothetical protein CAPTEDRAFT_190172 [Capitella teleta]